jgi:hypothetical protein
MRRWVSIAFVAFAIALAEVGSSHGQAMSGHGSGDQHGDRAGVRDGDHRDHDGDHDSDHGRRHDGERRQVIIWNFSPYPMPAPAAYWWYCPSAEAYYPYVDRCVDAWVPVLAR